MNQNIKGLSMNNVSYNRNFKTGNDQRINHRSFVLNGVASAQIALRLGYALGTVFVLCASNTYAAVIDNSAKTLEQQTAQTNVAALPAITVKAEQDDTYAGGQVSSKSSVGFLGNKTVMETPFNTIAYTDTYIADKQAKDITSVIAKTDPSVFTNAASGGWSENYYIRGFESSPSDMSMNGLFGITPYYRTSPEMFEKINVLKGPSALLNGMPPTGSIGGTVDLTTKRATDEPLTRLTTTYMSDSQFGGHLDVGRRFGSDKEFGVRANAVYRDGSGPVEKQDLKTELFSLGMDWHGDRARVSTDLYTSKDRVDGVTRGINLGKDIAIPKPPKPETLLNPDWSFVDIQDKGAMIRGEYDLTNNVMGYATYGQSKTEYKYNGAMSATVLDNTGTFQTSIGQLTFNVDKKSADVGLKGKFNTGAVGHQWVVNATYYKHNQDDYGVRNVAGAEWTTNLYDPIWGKAVPFNAPLISNSELQLNSYGLADTLSFIEDRLQLTLGVRYQEVESSNLFVPTSTLTKYKKNATTPGAAILFKATDKVSIYANYIEGLTKGEAAPLTAANYPTIFAPYKTKQTEFGVKFDQGTFAHTLSLFEIKKPSAYTDLVTNIYTSGGEQRNRGIEWSFFGSPIENVRLMGGASYIEPEVTKTAIQSNEGNMAVGVPKTQGKLGVEWDNEVAQGVLTLSSNATAVSKQYIDQENTLHIPGRTLIDVGARYKTSISNHPITFKADINNLMNKAYWGMPKLSNLALGAPRTYMLSVSYDF